MKIYLAPLQGLTDWVFRDAFTSCIGQFDKTFTPFIRVQNNEWYRPAQCNDILPENNRYQQPVPQFLGNDVSSFLKFEALCKSYEYQEVNINLGCPFPMVTNRKMGSGFLPFATELEQFLISVFEKTSMKISIKCRIGLEKPEEFESLIPVFNSLPFTEIIVHPRLGIQQYKGTPDKEAYMAFSEKLKHSLCYNGDISAAAEVQAIKDLAPATQSVMIGRGILKNPFLFNEIKGEILSENEKRLRLKAFHEALVENCQRKYSGGTSMLHRFTELWEYQSAIFTDQHKVYKQIRKCKTFKEYEQAYRQIIETREIVK